MFIKSAENYFFNTAEMNIFYCIKNILEYICKLLIVILIKIYILGIQPLKLCLNYLKKYY